MRSLLVLLAATLVVAAVLAADTESEYGEMSRLGAARSLTGSCDWKGGVQWTYSLGVALLLGQLWKGFADARFLLQIANGTRRNGSASTPTGTTVCAGVIALTIPGGAGVVGHLDGQEVGEVGEEEAADMVEAGEAAEADMVGAGEVGVVDLELLEDGEVEVEVVVVVVVEEGAAAVVAEGVVAKYPPVAFAIRGSCDAAVGEEVVPLVVVVEQVVVTIGIGDEVEVEVAAAAAAAAAVGAEEEERGLETYVQIFGDVRSCTNPEGENEKKDPSPITTQSYHSFRVLTRCRSIDSWKRQKPYAYVSTPALWLKTAIRLRSLVRSDVPALCSNRASQGKVCLNECMLTENHSYDLAAENSRDAEKAFVESEEGVEEEEEGVG
ncbi:hypothetical protein BSKO_12566 [Bryopsis sp. KO-2023]|nr:hypothetical protein BSKO_12566 [Bryopsis sp. KO-2023]